MFSVKDIVIWLDFRKQAKPSRVSFEYIKSSDREIQSTDKSHFKGTTSNILSFLVIIKISLGTYRIAIVGSENTLLFQTRNF